MPGMVQLAWETMRPPSRRAHSFSFPETPDLHNVRLPAIRPPNSPRAMRNLPGKLCSPHSSQLAPPHAPSAQLACETVRPPAGGATHSAFPKPQIFIMSGFPRFGRPTRPARCATCLGNCASPPSRRAHSFSFPETPGLHNVRLPAGRRPTRPARCATCLGDGALEVWPRSASVPSRGGGARQPKNWTGELSRPRGVGGPRRRLGPGRCRGKGSRGRKGAGRGGRRA